jgi:hypothetical protein
VSIRINPVVLNQVCPDHMSYVIGTYKDCVPYLITADSETNSFQLVEVKGDSTFNKVFSHPYRAGAYNVLTWIQKNDSALASEDLNVFDEARFRK